MDLVVVLEPARERFPDEKPRVISDNGPQFIARDFKEYIRISGMTHVRTSPYYPQSNGKLERFHKTIKGDAIRPASPVSLEDARTVVARYVEHYNAVRLHSAIGYITPHDLIAGRAAAIWADRDRKLEAAPRCAASAGTPLHNRPQHEFHFWLCFQPACLVHAEPVQSAVVHGGRTTSHAAADQLPMAERLLVLAAQALAFQSHLKTVDDQRRWFSEMKWSMRTEPPELPFTPGVLSRLLASEQRKKQRK